jgi:hypothetical protein
MASSVETRTRCSSEHFPSLGRCTGRRYFAPRRWEASPTIGQQNLGRRARVQPSDGVDLQHSQIKIERGYFFFERPKARYARGPRKLMNVAAAQALFGPLTSNAGRLTRSRRATNWRASWAIPITAIRHRATTDSSFQLLFRAMLLLVSNCGCVWRNRLPSAIVSLALMEVVSKPFHLASVLFRRPAGAPVPDGNLRDDFLGPDRGVVEIAAGGDVGTHPLGYHGGHFEDPVESGLPDPDGVSRNDNLCGLGGFVV